MTQRHVMMAWDPAGATVDAPMGTLVVDGRVVGEVRDVTIRVCGWPVMVHRGMPRGVVAAVGMGMGMGTPAAGHGNAGPSGYGKGDSGAAGRATTRLPAPADPSPDDLPPAHTRVCGPRGPRAARDTPAPPDGPHAARQGPPRPEYADGPPPGWGLAARWARMSPAERARPLTRWVWSGVTYKFGP